jgi:hypothetical protein
MGPLFLAAGIGLIFGIGGSEIRRFERQAAAGIAALFEGGRTSVEVEVDGPFGALSGGLSSATIRASGFSAPGLPFFVEPERSRKGRIGVLRIELDDFRLAGLRVDRLEASIPGCRYDFVYAIGRGGMRLTHSGEGEGYVRVRERDLEAWILRKYREIESVWVRVDKDRLWVEGYGRFLLARTGFQMIADLEAVDGTRLHLTRAKVYFDWVRAAPEAARALVDALNPVLDLSTDLGLHDAFRVERIRLRDGFVEAWGRARVPVRRGGDRAGASGPPGPVRPTAWLGFGAAAAQQQERAEAQRGHRGRLGHRRHVVPVNAVVVGGGAVATHRAEVERLHEGRRQIGQRGVDRRVRVDQAPVEAVLELGPGTPDL